MEYPATAAAAEFTPSPGVTFTTWTPNGLQSVHFDADHSASSHTFHYDYPNDVTTDRRNK